MTTNMRILPLMTAKIQTSPVMTANIQNSPVMTAAMPKSLVSDMDSKDDRYMWHVGHGKTLNWTVIELVNSLPTIREN